jgi:hypothetical protein
MTAWIIPFAILTAVALGAAALGLFGLYRSKIWFQAAYEAARAVSAAQARDSATISALHLQVESLAGQVAEIQNTPPSALLPGIPKPGMNLTKRTQALRLHRNGETPQRIAANLEMPLQEVNLLLKVHEILMKHM